APGVHRGRLGSNDFPSRAVATFPRCRPSAVGSAFHFHASASGIVIDPTSEFRGRSEEHTSELQSRGHLVCRLLLEKKKQTLHVHRHIVQMILPFDHYPDKVVFLLDHLSYCLVLVLTPSSLLTISNLYLGVYLLLLH